MKNLLVILAAITLLSACNITPAPTTEIDIRYENLLSIKTGGKVKLKKGIEHKFIDFADNKSKWPLQINNFMGDEYPIDKISFIVFGEDYVFVKPFNGTHFVITKRYIMKRFSFSSSVSVYNIGDFPILKNKGEVLTPRMEDIDYIIMDGENKTNIGIDLTNEIKKARKIIEIKDDQRRKRLIQAERKEKEHKNALEDERQRLVIQKNMEIESKKREKIKKNKLFKADLSNPANKGAFLCKKGALSYYNPWGSRPTKVEGIIIVNFMEYNKFNNMMKILTAGWKTLSGEDIHMAKGTHPSLDGISGQQGITLFVSADGFQPWPCS
jgi:hypothetical protein